MGKKGLAGLITAAILGIAGAAPGAAAPAVGAPERPAYAQETPERRPARSVRPRIEVRPAERQIYRECVDTTREVWRPYWGYVVMPSMRCWWVRR
jgi:hypothetical protein